MKNGPLIWIARGAGILGVVICAVAGLARLAGMYYILGHLPIGTLFQAGIAGMVLGCLAYLVTLAEHRAGAG